MEGVNPRKDGEDHINVSKNGKTVIGRRMAEFNVPAPIVIEAYPPALKEQYIKKYIEKLMPKVEADESLYLALQESSLRLWSYDVVDGQVVDFCQAEIWTELRGQLYMEEDFDQGFVRNPAMAEIDPNYKEPELPGFIRRL